MTSSYGILFSIDLLHEYYVSLVKCPDFDLIPTESCQQLFKAMGVQWRQNGNSFSALIRQNDAQEPFMNTPRSKSFRSHYASKVFSFYLVLKNPLFLNYTNLDRSFTAGRKFYFSNLSGNGENGFLFLSAPVAEFTNGKQYYPGDLARDAKTGVVYEALRKYTSKKKAELTDEALWTPKGLLHLSTPANELSAGRQYTIGELARQPGTSNVFEALRKHTCGGDKEFEDASLWVPRGQGELQYPAERDLVDYSTGKYSFALATAATRASISISTFNFKNQAPDFDVPARPAETRNFETSVTEVPISLANLAPGKYEVKVNKESKTIYYDPALAGGTILGVIDIFNHLPGTDDYALLTDDEKIRKIRYQLLFPSRRVLWKYIRKDGRAKTITDTGQTGYHFNLRGDEFVSATPIPMSESVVKTLALDFNTSDFRMFPLPNPPLSRLARCTQDDYDYMCSELYLNY